MIHQDLTQENAQLKAMVAEMQAKLEAQRNRKTTLKISEKGALSIYGLGRFPVTLYKGQWEKLIAAVPEIKAFMAENNSRLSVKD